MAKATWAPAGALIAEHLGVIPAWRWKYSGTPAAYILWAASRRATAPAAHVGRCGFDLGLVVALFLAIARRTGRT